MFFYLWDRRIVWTVLCCLFLFIFGLALAFRVFPSPPDDVFFHRLVREDQGWSVELPVTTVILEEYRYPSEEEVLFHLAFQDPVLKFRGVLEKWCLSDMKGFLQSSRERTDLVLSEYRCRETGNYIELFYRQEGREESCIGREFYLSREKAFITAGPFFFPHGFTARRMSGFFTGLSIHSGFLRVCFRSHGSRVRQRTWERSSQSMAQICWYLSQRACFKR